MAEAQYDRTAGTDEQVIAERLLHALHYSRAMMAEELFAQGSLSHIAFADISASLALLEKSGLVHGFGGRYRFYEISDRGQQEARRLSEPRTAYVARLPRLPAEEEIAF